MTICEWLEENYFPEDSELTRREATLRCAQELNVKRTSVSDKLTRMGYPVAQSQSDQSYKLDEECTTSLSHLRDKLDVCSRMEEMLTELGEEEVVHNREMPQALDISKARWKRAKKRERFQAKFKDNCLVIRSGKGARGTYYGRKEDLEKLEKLI